MGFWSGIADAFSRDGSATRFCEKLPVIGHVTAGVQLLAGNPEHAKRAAATATNSTLTTGGAVLGFMAGGPPGAVAGAMLGSTAGIGCEYGISTAINDESVKGNVGDVSIHRFVIDGVLSGGTAFIPGGTAAIGTAGKEAAKQVASSAVKTGLVTGVFTGMQGMSKDQPRPATGDDPEKPKDKGLVRVITLGQEEAAQHLLGLVTAFKTELAIASYDNLTRSNPDDPRPLGGLCYNFQGPLATIRLDCEWAIVNGLYEGEKKVWTDNEDCFVRLESKLEETKAENEAKWVTCRDGRVAIRNAIAVLDERMATQDVRVPRDIVANCMNFAVV
ncbi:hypothetical protein AG0111_0g8832 [Alternaria gaisen]|uniref:Uncharacterized protein n=1 Tax=Alternaria gaisen TaxID=167740 RepID=A0ACB6FD77_9PLEO|nr:hypothetical protein AG0111_0g8832 [Alternaria gaisen]